MDEPQKKLSPRHEGRPRKVRFKISSAYSGRVLKQVYEDGQELEPPAKEHSRRFLRHSFEPEDHFCRAGEALENRFYWPTALTAQRISILRDDQEHSLTGISPLLTDCQPGASHCRASPVVDFGKIIIYTNNLKIIRAPIDQKELMRRIIQTEGINDCTFLYRERKERFGGGHKDMEKKVICNQYVQPSYVVDQYTGKDQTTNPIPAGPVVWTLSRPSSIGMDEFIQFEFDSYILYYFGLENCKSVKGDCNVPGVPDGIGAIEVTLSPKQTI
ncbi:Glutaredoxin domain-containing cysteine-rich protein 2 [Pitangus sulphuratus]|nr:Glutaredoxin domain-containing cysteine-rich protein 2 [Pitangus sulphuratus]